MRVYSNGTVLVGGKLTKVDIACDNGTILGIASNITPPQGSEHIDCTGKFILPALIDIHTHGAAGYDFNTASLAQMHTIVNSYLAHGVGTVLPTIMTDDIDVMIEQIHRVLALSSVYSEIEGIHLEGPWLCADKCGAMPPQHILEPNIELFDRLYQESCGFIKVVTIAPEMPHALDLIRHIVSKGVIASIGHSNASYEMCNYAVKAGTTSFTHTGNAMSQLTQRQPGVMGCALTSGCYCEVIPDGLHLHKATLNAIINSVGIDRVVAITDSIMAATLPDGQYTLAGNAVTVTDNRAVLTGTDTLAGSTLTADGALASLIEQTGLPLDRAILTMTANPAKLLGIYDRVGSIDIGKKSNLLILG